MTNTNTSTDRLFLRIANFPTDVTWNELFDICERARKLSRLLDEQNTIRKSEGRSTLLLVSHDRAFLNNVVTSTLVFRGNGQIKEYAGGYDDYLRSREAATT